MADADRFLRDVADHLPFDRETTAEVVEELAAHLQDSSEAMIGSGVSPDDALRRSVAAMGDPRRLAGEIARAHQTPERLLAAAGAGAWSAAKAGFKGLFIGWVVAIIVGVVVSMLIQSVLRASSPGRALPDFSDGSATTLVSVIPWGFAAYLAARTTPRVVASVSRRSVRWSQLIGGLAVAALALILGLFWVRGGQSIFSVLALVTLPLWAIVGAWRADRPPARWLMDRRLLLLPVLALLGVLPFTLPRGTGVEIDEPRQVPWTDPYAGLLAAGQADLLRGGGPLLTVQSYRADDNARLLAVAVERPLPPLREIRVEVWPAVDRSMDGPPTTDGSRPGPITIVPLDLAGATMGSASRVVDFSGFRRVGRVYLLATGLSSDGARYLLSEPEFDQIDVKHSAWDWLLAS